MEDTKEGNISGRTLRGRKLLPCSLEKFTPKKVGQEPTREKM